MGADAGRPASFVGDVFREVHKALKETAEQLPNRDVKAGF
jgi:hypothetical protein